MDGPDILAAAARAAERAANTSAPADWQAALLRDDRRQVLPNIANAAHALRHAPELAGLLAFDEMAVLPLLRRPVPDSRATASTEPRPLKDADVTAAAEWMQSNGLPRIGRETVQQAVDLVARENGFHPVRDYLDGLTWDGKPRLRIWLSYYLGAKSPNLFADEAATGAGNLPPVYLDKIGTMFLVGMVARIMQPGCKLDYLPVLDGPQGVRKSGACAVLGGRWFSDSLPDLGSGDLVRLSQHLRGKWLIEIPEMSAFSRAEAAALKAFLTRTEERYTPKYGRQEVIEPRACCFIGTTNESAYLRDGTGNRRFWPVTVVRCDTDALARDRDQLFAEAVHLFRRGAQWWPDADFERDHIEREQEGRFVADEWESMIAEAVAAMDKTTVGEVAEKLFISRDKLGTAEQRRIAAALLRLKWTMRRGARGIRWWYPPDPPEQVTQ
jgi:predicted P-loop ATPase